MYCMKNSFFCPLSVFQTVSPNPIFVHIRLESHLASVNIKSNFFLRISFEQHSYVVWNPIQNHILKKKKNMLKYLKINFMC